jgi:hypothetical protein
MDKHLKNLLLKHQKPNKPKNLEKNPYLKYLYLSQNNYNLPKYLNLKKNNVEMVLLAKSSLKIIRLLLFCL